MSKLIFLPILLIMFGSCIQNSNQSIPCDEFSADVFEWIPNKQGDTVSILVNNKDMQFVFRNSDYTYDPEAFTPGGFGGGEYSCDNFWGGSLDNSTHTFIGFNLQEDDFTKAYLSINCSPYYFKEFNKLNNQEFAIFEVDSLNDSSYYDKIVLERNVGFKRLEIRKRKK